MEEKYQRRISGNNGPEKSIGWFIDSTEALTWNLKNRTEEEKEKEAKKNQKKTVIKEIRFTATTDKHDLETKAKAANKFLDDGRKVKVAVFIKGRRMQRRDIVKETMTNFLDLVKDHCTMEKAPDLLGRDYFVRLNPKNAVTKKQGGQTNAKEEE